jgi:aspartate racemase
MKNAKLITIGGGVGPMAGVELHKKIIENTLTNGTDQDHLEVHHFSRSHDVADRTDYLLNKVDSNPAEGMFRSMQMAAQAARIAGREAVAGIPCNTFHAPLIFQQFIQKIQEHDIKIKILHMLEEVVGLISQVQSQAKTIGLMSTTGTRVVHVYNDVLEPHGLNIVQVPQDTQPELHDSIYNQQWGIKALSPVSEKARSNFEKYAKLLYDQGADTIILGCTEIPLALPEQTFKDVPLIDPMFALARALIREVDEGKLRPLRL